MSISAIKTTLDRIDFDVTEADMPDSFEDVHANEHYITPMGEIVVVDSVEIAHDAASSEITLRYPERPSLDPDGEDTAFSYTTSVESWFARMDADGGWARIPLAVFTDGTINCPRCNKFMNKHGGVRDFPYPECRCGCVKHYEDLEADSDVVPVLL